MIEAIFHELCPNCGRSISSLRAYQGYLCSKCSPQPVSACEVPKKLGIRSYCYAEDMLRQWEEYFTKHEGTKPWSLQRFWAKRIFLGRSFSMLAPTGIGKSTFGISMAAFLSKKGRTAIIVPTRLLVQQTLEKIKKYGVKTASSLNKEEVLKGDYEVLVITHMFLYKNIQHLPRDFKYVFVDDVDSFLKSARNVDKLLLLIGFSRKDIELAEKVLKGELPEDVLEKVKRKRHGVVTLASATSKPKSSRIKLFRLLLDFDVGRPKFYLRNVEDFYDEERDMWYWLPKLGKTGLVFGVNREQALSIYQQLLDRGYKAVLYEDVTPEIIEKFRKKEIDVLVGIASYRNPLARGLDVVETRYALFAGVPRIEFDLTKVSSPSLTLVALNMIRGILPEEYLEKVDHYIKVIKESNSVPEDIVDFFLSIKDYLKESDEITITEDLKMVFADVAGYLQASGRTSRMYPGGIAKGLALLLVDDRKAFNNLKRKIKWYAEVEFKKAEEEEIARVLQEIDEERAQLGKKREFDPLKPVFVIVESPNKARTIANFFGRPVRLRTGKAMSYEFITGDKYVVITASLGHILDLITNMGYHGTLINGKVVPIYEKLEDKVEQLREVAKQSFSLYVATDPDTEGEKIAWDLVNMLRVYAKEVKRMEFHEVTRKAILEALNNPREVNEDLVKAQIVRRVADRWVGFELSQLLQRRFRNPHLSSGRVQTPVLGWVVKREEEARQKKYKVVVDGWEVVLEEKEKAEKVYKALEYEIKIDEIIEEEVNPKPPYTTDTLLRDAYNELKLSPQKAMDLAQELFEGGFITYHRTDSIHVSEVGRHIAKEYLERKGWPYYGRSWGPEGTHEAIRPTRAMDVRELKSFLIANNIELSNDHLRLYDLIFRRFIASQMPAAKVKKAKVKLVVAEIEQEYELIIEILEKGFTLIWPLEVREIKEGKFVPQHREMRAIPKVPRYTYATLIAEMKEKGIGRPSTYAITVEKLLERKYIKDINGVIYPTQLGIKVYNYLVSLPKIRDFISEEFTRQLEELMDEVEQGKRDYQETLFYILEELKKALDGMARI
ncbi:MAG: reverse gyrase [Candidatus Micrarchaeota archaeon]|nr:reverse gyrase [Candidatus Micrarchaeota archaeon]